jgi:tetratricopeptide (TPR) repeat protein
VRDELIRVTGKAGQAQALEALEQAAAAFSQGQYRKALAQAETAKAVASRDATVRELLGLSAYRLGRWEQALSELRTYRRIAGDTTHLPVEMDALRALDRPADVEKAWKLLSELGGTPATVKEGRVVYASFLLDEGRPRDAWKVANPGRIEAEPFEEDLRLWYVAARTAARLEDAPTARKLLDAITQEAPGFPGLDALEDAVIAASRRPD